MATIMRQTLTTKDKIMLILLSIGIAIILFGLALVISGLKVSAHTRYHEYPKPCDTGLVGTQEATISYEGGEDIKICPTIEPSVSPDVTETPEASPTAEVTVEPTAPAGSGVSDGQHTAGDGLHSGPDGLGCATHECKSSFDGAPVIWK